MDSLVSAEWLGFTDVAVYDGSLDEWTSNPDNPMDIDLDGFETDPQ